MPEIIFEDTGDKNPATNFLFKRLVIGFIVLQHAQCIFTAPKETRIVNTKILSLSTHGIQIYWEEKSICIITGQSYWERIGKILWTMNKGEHKMYCPKQDFFERENRHELLTTYQNRDVNH